MIPFPASFDAGEQLYCALKSGALRIDGDGKAAAAKLALTAGFAAGGVLLSGDAGRAAEETAINFLESRELRHEEYVLQVTENRIDISAAGESGYFYGAQTLLQLTQPGKKQGRIIVPVCLVKDAPRFGWRGLMLDVCRHYFSLAEIKKIIDLLATLKMNILHLHLTDDQAWRLEIKRYPELTAKAAWRRTTGGKLREHETEHYNADGQYGGYYSQRQIEELIEYAQARAVTIVPEIELPGHSHAPVLVYPWLGCSGGPYESQLHLGLDSDESGRPVPGTFDEVFKDVYCAGNDQALEFLRNVLDEVAALFPSEYIHIGGDECDKQRWRSCPKCQKRIRDEQLAGEDGLQSWFVRQIEEHLQRRGKKLIGWDEILEGGLAPRAAVMSWRGNEGGIKAAALGHEAVMTPVTHCYFDYYQSAGGESDGEPRGIGGFLPLEQVYRFEPCAAGIAEEQKHFILGGQANMWTEYVQIDAHLEYMLLPRLLAIAEALWTPPEQRDWVSFRGRAEIMLEILGKRGYNYRRSR